MSASKLKRKRRLQLDVARRIVESDVKWKKLSLGQNYYEQETEHSDADDYDTCSLAEQLAGSQTYDNVPDVVECLNRLCYQ